VFALSVPFDAIGHLLARGLYSTHNTVLALVAALVGFGVTVVVTLGLVAPLDIVAIPVGYAAGLAARTVVQAVALAWRLRTGRAPGAVAATPA